jgi:hypothetical protein
MAAPWGRNLQAPPASTPDSRLIVFIAQSFPGYRWTARGEADADRAGLGSERRQDAESELPWSDRRAGGHRSAQRIGRTGSVRRDGMGLAPSMRERRAGLVRRLVTCSSPSDFVSTYPTGVANCVLHKAPRFLRVPPAGSSASEALLASVRRDGMGLAPSLRTGLEHQSAERLKPRVLGGTAPLEEHRLARRQHRPGSLQPPQGRLMIDRMP